MMAFFVLITALTFGVVRASGSFNADELTSVFYDVDILGEPKLTTEMTQSPTSMLLLSKHGQRYECHLPVNEHTLGSGVAPDDAAKSQTHTEEEKSEVKASLLSIPKLLDHMSAENCLRLSKGWWEYEFCFRNRIRQFHINDQTGAIENEIILGHFLSDYDWNDIDLNSLTNQGPKKSSRALSHSQLYTGGSTCDLTGQPRRAEVRFYCDPAPLTADSLVDVEEPSSCVYRLTVRTGRLCAHPLLRKAAEEEMPSRRKPAESIQCRPLLEPASMLRYRKSQAAKRLAALKAAELQKLRHIQRLNPLRRLARIRHVVAGRLGRPLRRRKLAQLVRRRRQRLKRASKAKEATSKLKGGFAGGNSMFKNLLRALPESVRRKLTSKQGVETLRTGVGAQFEQVLQEARREVGDAGEATQLPQEGRDRELLTGPNGMSTMLDKILSQIQEAGRKLEAEMQLKDSEPRSTKTERGKSKESSLDPVDSQQPDSKLRKKSTEAQPDSKLRKKSTEAQPDSKLRKKSTEAQPDSKLRKKSTEAQPDSKLRKKSMEAQPEKKRPGRASKVKSGAGAGAGTGESESSLLSAEVEKLRDRLESGLRERMDRRGMETNGLTLHLMSLGDSQGGKEDESGQGKSFVGIIILKNDRQIQEQERMQRMEDNYNFRVDNEPVL